MARDREPHIGEYDAKTNALRDCPRTPPRQIRVDGRRLRAASAALLPVVFQYLLAGLGQFGPILLKARQHREVALIDHRAAVALNVTRTGRLFFRRTAALLLGDGSAGNRQRQQDEWQEKFMHRVPSF
jgi:hypothetical protein